MSRIELEVTAAYAVDLTLLWVEERANPVFSALPIELQRQMPMMGIEPTTSRLQGEVTEPYAVHHKFQRSENKRSR